MYTTLQYDKRLYIVLPRRRIKDKDFLSYMSSHLNYWLRHRSVLWISQLPSISYLTCSEKNSNALTPAFSATIHQNECLPVGWSLNSVETCFAACNSTAMTVSGPSLVTVILLYNLVTVDLTARTFTSPWRAITDKKPFWKSVLKWRRLTNQMFNN
jgi:hypothetical protein